MTSWTQAWLKKQMTSESFENSDGVFRLFQPEFWRKMKTLTYLDLKIRWPQNSCENSDQSEFIITTFEKCSSQMKNGRRQNNLGVSVDMLYYILLWRDRDFNPCGKFWLRDIESYTISLLFACGQSCARTHFYGT